MLLKKGIVFPDVSEIVTYPATIAYALKHELGNTHRAVKTLMRWTGAGERTVKNWLAGSSGPSGEHLVRIIENSDDALMALLILAGRREALAATQIIEMRNKLADAIEQVDRLLEK